MGAKIGLDDVERAFRAWRRGNRTKAIPEDLWELAARAAGVHGVTMTAQRLGLNAHRRVCPPLKRTPGSV